MGSGELTCAARDGKLVILWHSRQLIPWRLCCSWLKLTLNAFEDIEAREC